MEHDGGGGLLRDHLVGAGERDADVPLRVEELPELLLVGELRPGRVAGRVALALVGGHPELAAHPRVPEVGEGLGGLHREAVQVEGAGVVPLSSIYLGDPRGLVAHGDHLEGHHVGAALGAEVVGEAEVSLVGLAREGEAHPLLAPVHRVEHDAVVPLGVAGEVPVDHPRREPALGRHLGLQLLEARAELLPGSSGRTPPPWRGRPTGA